MDPNQGGFKPLTLFTVKTGFPVIGLLDLEAKKETKQNYRQTNRQTNAQTNRQTYISLNLMHSLFK